MARITREKFKTFANVFDQFTERTIFRLIAQGHLQGIERPLLLGKEANVFVGLAEDGQRVILKVYRLSVCDFTRMYTYIRTDPRFKRVPHSQRKVVLAWAQREFRNLLRARELGARVPAPYAVLNNVLVMEYIGDDGIAAPKWLSAPASDPEKFGDDIIQQMRILYVKGMVHGDLSPFNVLNHHDVPVLIDMSQSTVADDAQFGEFVRRDVKNVCAHLVRLGVHVSEADVLERVTGKMKPRSMS